MRGVVEIASEHGKCAWFEVCKFFSYIVICLSRKNLSFIKCIGSYGKHSHMQHSFRKDKLLLQESSGINSACEKLKWNIIISTLAVKLQYYNMNWSDIEWSYLKDFYFVLVLIKNEGCEKYDIAYMRKKYIVHTGYHLPAAEVHILARLVRIWFVIS